MSGANPAEVIGSRAWLTEKGEATLALPPTPTSAADFLAKVADENRAALKALNPRSAA